jgi:aspartyl-tRNA(Asn)/glutamyl-tRNA(Gln) amidotransferase subunit B
MFAQDIDPVRYVEEKGLKQENDAGAIRGICEQVLADNPQSVADFKAGKDRALGFLVGQTMKAMKGQADPVRIKEILRICLTSANVL